MADLQLGCKNSMMHAAASPLRKSTQCLGKSYLSEMISNCRHTCMLSMFISACSMSALLRSAHCLKLGLGLGGSTGPENREFSIQ